jgi:hypothetical protein
MAFIPDLAAFKKSFDSLPISTFEPGETVLAAGSTTGQLFILRKGVIEVVRDGLQIATVSESGAVFGELSLILDKPHTAEVRALERSAFHVAKASSLLTDDVAALLYVSAILARRLDTANEVLVEIKRELESAKQPAITKALKKLEKLLSPTGANTSDFNYLAYYPPMFWTLQPERLNLVFDVALITVPGTQAREFALEVIGPTGTTLVLNDIVANIRDSSGFGGWLLRLMGFAGDRPNVPVPIKWVLIKDKAAFAAQLRRWAELPALKRVLVSHGSAIIDEPASILRKLAASLD